jgi:predicted GIY-YIG superfamily endonuclease
LLQSARLGLAIRGEYARLKKDPAAKFYTYVLQLQEGKFYVGNTDNIYTRLLDHKLMSTSSALWVKHYGPVARVVEIARNSSASDEHYKTMLYMSMFGWENVRGSSYCKIQMFRPPEALKAFTRVRDGEFEYLTPQEIDAVWDAVDDLRLSV